MKVEPKNLEEKVRNNISELEAFIQNADAISEKGGRYTIRRIEFLWEGQTKVIEFDDFEYSWHFGGMDERYFGRLEALKELLKVELSEVEIKKKEEEKKRADLLQNLQEEREALFQQIDNLNNVIHVLEATANCHYSPGDKMWDVLLKTRDQIKGKIREEEKRIIAKIDKVDNKLQKIKGEKL